MLMSEWNLPWSGQCRCGETRVQVNGAPLLSSACHCRGCQKMAASAFSLTLSIPAGGFEVVAGEPVLGGLQTENRHFFCPSCKTWMFTRPAGLDWLVNVRPGILDNHRWVTPFAEFWTSEKLPWAVTPAAHSFETTPGPAEFEPLIRSFAEKGARPPAPAGANR